MTRWCPVYFTKQPPRNAAFVGSRSGKHTRSLKENNAFEKRERCVLARCAVSKPVHIRTTASQKLSVIENAKRKYLLRWPLIWATMNRSVIGVIYCYSDVTVADKRNSNCAQCSQKYSNVNPIFDVKFNSRPSAALFGKWRSLSIRATKEAESAALSPKMRLRLSWHT